MAGSLTLLAASQGLQRVDQVLLSVATDSAPAGSRVFVVQGDADNPAHHRAGMDTALAVQTPFAQSVQQLQVLEHQREQGLAAEMVAQVAQAEPAGRGMALG
nr:XVIPCD domain-containing protein [Stenotrophomonas ginsengisoli]